MTDIAKYSEDQPRDDDGRWEGGGATEPQSMREKEAPKFVHDFNAAHTSINSKKAELKSKTTEHLKTALRLMSGHEDAGTSMLRDLINTELKSRGSKIQSAAVSKYSPSESRDPVGRWGISAKRKARAKHGDKRVPKASTSKTGGKEVHYVNTKAADGDLDKGAVGMSMNLFVPITKVDVAKRMVYGRAVQEVVDRVGEIFDYTTSKPHFEAWSKSFAEATDGKNLGNIRAMHGKVSAGVTKQIDFNDTEKAIDIGAHINDDQEWQKVIDGNYTGFSIGGSYIGDRITEKIGDKEVKRYTANPSEISIVDSPCIPTARFFDIVKVDGSVEKVAFKPAQIEVKGTDEQVSQFGVALNDSGFSLADAIEFVRDASMLDTVESLEKREFSADERKSAAKQGQALPDGSFPIKTVGDLHNAVRAYGRAKNKAAAKAHIIKRAKALGAMDAIPDAWNKSDGDSEKMQWSEVSKLIETDPKNWAKIVEPFVGIGYANQAEAKRKFEEHPPLLRKGLYNVGRFAECLECLAEIARSAEGEAQSEEDDSKVPSAMRNAIDDLIECFKEMSDEESAEMLAELKDHAGVGEDDEIEEGLEMAFHLSTLTKSLMDPELPIVELAKIATEYEEPLTTAVLTDMPGLRKRIIAKAGARHSKVDADHLQQAHDHLVGMGADCYGSDGEKKTPQGDLAKAVGSLQTKLDEQAKEIARLNAQPMPHVVTLRAVKKIEAQGDAPAKDVLAEQPYEKLVRNPDGSVDWKASETALNSSTST